MTFQRAIAAIGLTLVLFHGDASAAEVLWNQAFVVRMDVYEHPEALFYGMGQPYLQMDAERIGTGLELRARPECNLVGDNTFVKVDAGTIANESTVYGAKQHFAYAVANYEAIDVDDMFDLRADYSIFIDVGETVFLAFGNKRYNPSNPYPTTYGWVELGLDGNGDLVALASAWDMDGNPITVGAIPEPSSCLLLLLGVAMMSMKRKRKMI